MEEIEEKRIELMLLLNDIEAEATFELLQITELFNIIFVNESIKFGWFLIEDAEYLY